ncbi:MaoC/PaaZ C-terminal domain-containing protein [Bosea sp. 685]|uniref:MaoC/PaaZ C-terminal domain-containing protein n=1 Tax=Bosea sp. 685 TaxID=3080057 RepID=UPI0028930B1B|nr:MaoC/PaaZ C-terminal domain-containing protein [Bosea sp. 685]WNJ88084.1 MaoC/PaaZ C-terminal domain-containing protein [Bosea sp. 685]
MILDADRLLSLAVPARSFAYDDRQTLLYALACAADPVADLPFILERDQKVVPSFAQILGFSDDWLEVAQVPVALVVHGGLDIRFDAPFAPSGCAEVETAIVGLGDKGEGRGGIIHQQMRIFQNGSLVATSLSSLFVRGAGGFGGNRGAEPETITVPARPADETFEVATAANQSALFRLLGDRNLLHVDPEFARSAGFPAPILHGAATFGTACLAILKRCARGEPERLSRFAARFTGPVFPGETLVFQLWREPGQFYFRAFAQGRDKPVLDGGLAVVSGG